MPRRPLQEKDAQKLFDSFSKTAKGFPKLPRRFGVSLSVFLRGVRDE